MCYENYNLFINLGDFTDIIAKNSTESKKKKHESIEGGIYCTGSGTWLEQKAQSQHANN